jgi:hypothetical protein
VRPSFTLHWIYTKQFYRDKILSPEISSDENLRTPTVAKWLDGVALRDLQLHQKHAACIDARGDVYQWGEGFFGEAVKAVHSPKLTLRSKVRLSASARKGQWANAKRLLEYCSTPAHRREALCALCIWKGLYNCYRCIQTKPSRGVSYSFQ